MLVVICEPTCLAVWTALYAVASGSVASAVVVHGVAMW